jgi:hypothetical protein
MRLRLTLIATLLLCLAASSFALEHQPFSDYHARPAHLRK